MHLEIPADATLEGLDQFLRDTWLECCGHLSAFTIGEERYYSYSEGELDGEDMSASLGDLLKAGMKFHYEYDFGTTTELTLKVVGEQEGEVRGKSV
jgi:hypothetical protein